MTHAVEAAGLAGAVDIRRQEGRQALVELLLAQHRQRHGGLAFAEQGPGAQLGEQLGQLRRGGEVVAAGSCSLLVHHPAPHVGVPGPGPSQQPIDRAHPDELEDGVGRVVVRQGDHQPQQLAGRQPVHRRQQGQRPASADPARPRGQGDRQVPRHTRVEIGEQHGDLDRAGSRDHPVAVMVEAHPAGRAHGQAEPPRRARAELGQSRDGVGLDHQGSIGHVTMAG